MKKSLKVFAAFLYSNSEDAFFNGKKLYNSSLYHLVILTLIESWEDQRYGVIKQLGTRLALG